MSETIIAIIVIIPEKTACSYAGHIDVKQHILSRLPVYRKIKRDILEIVHRRNIVGSKILTYRKSRVNREAEVKIYSNRCCELVLKHCGIQTL